MDYIKELIKIVGEKNVRADLIGTACPYCLTMLFDGIKEKGKEETMAAYDLSELVCQSL